MIWWGNWLVLEYQRVDEEVNDCERRSRVGSRGFGGGLVTNAVADKHSRRKLVDRRLCMRSVVSMTVHETVAQSRSRKPGRADVILTLTRPSSFQSRSTEQLPDSLSR